MDRQRFKLREACVACLQDFLEFLFFGLQSLEILDGHLGVLVQELADLDSGSATENSKHECHDVP